MRTQRMALVFLLASVPVATLAQPPAETCGVGDSLDGGDVLGVTLVGGATSDDFTMSGTGCTEQGFDHVTCMVPTSSCSVDVTCTDVQVPPPTANGVQGLQVAVNAVQGACTTTPASCLDSGSGTGSGSIAGLALTAGTNYCFICESGASGIEVDIQLASGDCGALPVDLRSVAIE